jgi:hypothetical protein
MGSTWFQKGVGKRIALFSPRNASLDSLNAKERLEDPRSRGRETLPDNIGHIREFGQTNKFVGRTMRMTQRYKLRFCRSRACCSGSTSRGSFLPEVTPFEL